MAKYTNWITKEGLLKIEGWARDGLTDEQIAENIGIRRPTLYDWKKKYSDISDALKRGKEVVDRQVENALFKSAVGYEYTERTAKVVERDPDIILAERRAYANKYLEEHPDATPEEFEDAAIKAVPTRERIVFLEVDKQVAPNPTSAIFWLKNRKPNEWRDKKETELSGVVRGTNPFEGISTKDIKKLVNSE